MSACVPTTTCATPFAISSRIFFAPTEPVSSDAPHAELRAERLERQEVLLGERLRRRHQRALAARLDRAQERVERDDRLAGADVALQQPLHRRGAREVGVDLGDRALLVLGERERQRRRGSARSARPAAPSDGATASVVARRRDDELQREQLVEREPPPRPLRLAARRRGKWSAASASRCSGRSSSRRQRDRVRNAACAASAARTSSRSRVGRDLLARRVDRREVGRRCAPRRCRSS